MKCLFERALPATLYLLGAAAVLIRAVPDARLRIQSLVGGQPMPDGASTEAAFGGAGLALLAYTLLAFGVVAYCKRFRQGKGHPACDWTLLGCICLVLLTAWWPVRTRNLYYPDPVANSVIVHQKDGTAARIPFEAPDSQSPWNPQLDESRDINASSVIARYGMQGYLNPDAAGTTPLQEFALEGARYQHPPGFYFLFAPIHAHPVLQRFLCLLMLAGSLALLVRYAPRAAGVQAGGLAALAMVSAPGLVHGLAFKVNADVHALLTGTLCAALLFGVEAKPGLKRILACCLLLCIAVMTRFTNAILVFGVAVVFLCRRDWKTFLILSVPPFVCVAIYHYTLYANGIAPQLTHLGKIVLGPFMEDVTTESQLVQGGATIARTMKVLLLVSLGPLAAIAWLAGIGSSTVRFITSGIFRARNAAMPVLLWVTYLFAIVISLINPSLRYASAGLWAAAMLVAHWVAVQSRYSALSVACMASATGYALTKLLIQGWLD